MAAEQILNENDFEDDFSDIDMEELDSYLTSPPVRAERRRRERDDSLFLFFCSFVILPSSRSGVGIIIFIFLNFPVAQLKRKDTDAQTDTRPPTRRFFSSHRQRQR